MPRNAMKVCARSGCPELVPLGTSRCDNCKRESDRNRGTARQRGYGGPGWQAARATTLLRDPLCVCDDTTHGHTVPCALPSTVADHWPDERKDLVARGVPDPDAPHRLRGVCRRCHDLKTAHSGIGWSTARPDPGTPGEWAPPGIDQDQRGG